MARLACTEFAADWVINNDADEFWWPERGDLKQVLGAVPPSCDAVVVSPDRRVRLSDCLQPPSRPATHGGRPWAAEDGRGHFKDRRSRTVIASAKKSSSAIGRGRKFVRSIA
jgi:hypothetical protein